MLKLIGLIIAAIPVVLFLRAILTGPLGRTRTVSRAVADFKKQVDYVVWAILVLIGCGLVYSVVKLLWDV
jgi:hypothetical protein